MLKSGWDWIKRMYWNFRLKREVSKYLDRITMWSNKKHSK